MVVDCATVWSDCLELIRKEVEEFYKGKIKIYDNAEVVAKKVKEVLGSKKFWQLKKAAIIIFTLAITQNPSKKAPAISFLQKLN